MTMTPTNRHSYLKYEEQHLYTLADLAFKDDGETGTLYINDISEVHYNDISEITQYLLNWTLPLELSNLITDPLVIELWYDYILPYFLNEYIAVSDLNITFSDLHPDIEKYNLVFGKFWRLFLNKIKSTYSRYSTLINLYRNNEQDLLKKIESITDTKARQNEVPEGSAVDPYDEEFANSSSVGIVTSQTDVATLAQRLAEIRKMWYSIFEEWRREFEPLFIEE